MAKDAKSSKKVTVPLEVIKAYTLRRNGNLWQPVEFTIANGAVIEIKAGDPDIKLHAMQKVDGMLENLN